MKPEELWRSTGRWLEGDGGVAEIVLSSRARLARNLSAFPFQAKITPEDQNRILEMVEGALAELSVVLGGNFLRIDQLTPNQIQALSERHLISPDFVTARNPRGVFIGADQSQSVMVNEEDHLRFQVLTSGLELELAYRLVNEIDDELGSRLEFAFSDQLGYLTACPTNLGTGLRASILVHIPGLAFTKEAERVLRGAMQIGFSVRGLYGEGSEAKGHFFQLSNQVTLGSSEAEIIESTLRVGRQIIELERRAEEWLLEKARAEIEDKIFRAWAILNNARVLTSEEVINLSSAVRFGVAFNLLQDVKLSTLNRLLILSQPASLQLYYGEELEPRERDERRAQFVRECLKSPES